MSRITIARRPPMTEAVVVDFAGRDAPQPRGVLLSLIEPLRLLTAARATRRHKVDWVVHNLDALPCREQRAAAFICALALTVRAQVIVVLDEDSLRRRRIAGHIRRAVARH